MALWTWGLTDADENVEQSRPSLQKNVHKQYKKMSFAPAAKMSQGGSQTPHV